LVDILPRHTFDPEPCSSPEGRLHRANFVAIGCDTREGRVVVFDFADLRRQFDNLAGFDGNPAIFS